MAIVDIEIWLKGKLEYASGLDLINRYSDNRALKMMLAKGETAFNREKMIEELTALNRSGEAEYKVRPQPQERKILDESEWMRAPEAVRELKKTATALFKENARKHAKLCHLAAEGKRLHGNDINAINKYLKENNAGIIANEILDADEEMAELFRNIDFWRANGKLPEDILPVAIDDTDKAELIRQRNNLRSNLSKARKKNKDAAVSEIENRIAMIQRRIDELD